MEIIQSESIYGLQIITGDQLTSLNDDDLNYHEEDTYLFSHGVLHSNGRIYGVPFNADQVLEIFTSDPPKLVLHSIPNFGKTILENPDLTQGVPTYEDSLSSRRISDVGSPDNESQSLVSSEKVFGKQSKIYERKLEWFYQYEMKLNEYLDIIKNDEEKKRLFDLSLRFPCLQLDTVTQRWKWKKGISFNDAIYFLPFSMEYVYAVKSRGNHLRFIPLGTRFNGEKQEEDLVSFSIVKEQYIKNKILPLNPYHEIIYPSGTSGYKILDQIPLKTFNPESGEIEAQEGSDINHAKFFDFVKIDNVIYGAPWCFSNKFHHQNQSLYRESGDKAARIFRFKPTDCEFVGTYHGIFNYIEKFSGATLFDDKIYTIPQDECSILEVIPSDDVNDVQMSFIGYLTQDIVGPIKTRKFMGVVKTPDALVYIPYNSERILILRKGGLLELPLEKIIGTRKFRAGVYCKKLDSIIMAPFDYPFVLMYSLKKKKLTSIYSFEGKLSEQAGKYSDILSFDDENFFCIPYGRKTILHIKIKSEDDIQVEELILPKTFDHYFIKGIIPKGKKEIYAIPYHGSSVLKISLRNKEDFELENEIKNELENLVINKRIELISNKGIRINNLLNTKKISPLSVNAVADREIENELIEYRTEIKDLLLSELDEKEVILDEFVLYNTAEKRGIGGKFSNVVEVDSKLVCVPFNAKEIVIIFPGDPPEFSAFEIYGRTDSDIPVNLLSSAFKFSSACEYRNGILFIPFGINYLLNLSLGSAKILNSESINIVSAKPEKYCEGIKIDDSVYLIPCTETRLLKLHSEL